MNVRRSWLFFLVMLLLSACAILLLAETPILESVRALQGAPEGRVWQAVGTNGIKLAAAVGWRDGDLELRYFTTDGELLLEQSAPLPEDMAGGTVSGILPLRAGVAFLGVYDADAKNLYLYRISGDGKAERLFSSVCSGASFQERVSRTAFSELSLEDGAVSFALRRDGTLERYRCREEGGLETVGKDACEETGVLSVLSTNNGALLLGGADALTVNGKSADDLVGGQTVTHLTDGRGGWYYLDANTLDVCFVDASLGTTQRMFRLDPVRDGVSQSVSGVALTREERALTLLDGWRLTVSDAEGTHELAGILSPTAAQSWLRLAKYALFALLAAAVLWLLLCGLRRGYASLVIFRGGLFIAAALLCFTALHFLYLTPMQQSATLRENDSLVSAALGTVRAEERMGDKSLADEICRVLAERTDAGGRNVRVVATTFRNDAWRAADGSRAELLDGFSPALADAARKEGAACAMLGGVFYDVRCAGSRCLSIRVEAPREADGEALSKLLLICFGVLALLVLLILLSISGSLRKISKRMERISQGSVPERLRLRTGDELESMATVVNSLGSSLKRQEEERESLEHSYRRFVPEKVLALLGKQSIREVDKSAFAARNMAVMTVWFSFPETLYTDMSSSQLLFDSVNEVIERTASIVARKGGTVFHFAYNGFDVVMDDGGEAVSTAVAIQQEVLSFNEQRSQDRLPAVTLRIALDKGNVMLGIVGDTSQMEPTTISTGLSTAQELIDLCNRLQASILCTEAIISEKQDYGNRYMGKCLVGEQPVRVYEVFDGDEFNVRRGKASSMREFSQGVYDLYGGDAAGAKHTFLQLAHTYPMDGGVRYYLYLADRLEHHPELPCVLNMDKLGGGEM